MRLVVVVALLALAPVPSPAAELPPPLQIREEIDLPLMLSFATLWLVTEQTIKDEFTAGPFDPLTYDDIGESDRNAIGNWSPAAAGASDVLLYASFALPFVLQGIDDIAWARNRQAPGAWFWTDAVLLVETIAFAGALTNLVKWTFNRYRPYMYIPYDRPEAYAGILQGRTSDRAAFEEALEDPDSALSFWSGHTSLAFAAMFATATLLTYKHLDDHPAPLFAAWGGALAMGITVGALRVRAGKHFPSDVLVGAVIGAAVGIVVPSLHRNRRDSQIVVTPYGGSDGGGLAMTARW